MVFPEAVSSTATRHYLVVMAGALRCALPLDQIAETLRPWKLRPTASQVAGMLGTTLIRGQYVPVIDVLAQLGLEIETTQRPRLVRVRLRNGREAALQVTHVIGTRAMTPGELEEDISIVLDATQLVDKQIWDDMTKTEDR